MKEIKNDVLTVPNLLSLFRLLLIPVFAVLYLRATNAKESLIAACVLGLSAVTDMADGIIARKCNMISRLGILLDPIADKLTQGVIMICLSLRHWEIIPLLVLFVIKEAFMLVMGCLHLKQRKMLDGALFTGKICTTVLFISMIALMIFPDLPQTALFAVVCLCAVFMLISLVSYAMCYFKKSPHIKDIE